MIAVEQGLATLCRRALPDWTALRVTEASPLPPRPSSLTCTPSSLRSLALIVEGGSGAQIYRKELVWRCHAERESCWALDDRDRAEREFLLLRALEARGFPVPHAYAWGREGGGWVLMEKAPGRPAEMGAAARRDALCWLSRLHAIAAEGIGQAPLPHVTLVGTLARAQSWGEEAGCTAVCESAEALCRRAALPESTGCLVHGDAHPDRFRVERGCIVGWLGWTTAAIGDPRWDLAGFLGDACDGDTHAALPIYAAAIAVRDWSAAACRTAGLTRERGAEHPLVLARAPLVDRLRRRCLTAVAALEAG